MPVYSGPLLPGQDQAAYRKYGIERSGGSTPYGYTSYNPGYTSGGGQVLGATDTNTGGGGGGGSAAAPSPTVQTPTPPQPDMAAINNLFTSTMDFLGSEQNRIQNQLPSVLEAAEKQFGQARQTLNTGRDESTRQLGEQEIQAEQGRQREQAESARLYQDLTQGFQNRFGAMSEAGTTAQALLGREQQRSLGQVQQQYSTAKREIANARVKLNDDYTNALSQLEQNLATTQLNIRSQFEDRLAQIRSMRAQTEDAKRNMKYAALQEYNNQMYNLQLSTMQYKQQLDLQASQYAQQLNDTDAAWEQMTGGTGQTVANFETANAGAPASNISIQGPQQSQAQATPTGRVGFTREELLAGTNPLGLPLPANNFQLGQGY